MRHLYQPLAFAGLMLALWAQATLAGEYKDASGFSFTYPDDWMIVNKQLVVDTTNQVVSREVKDWLARNNMDLNRISVVLIHKSQGEFAENLNVLVNNKELPANNETLEGVKKIVPQQLQNMGLKLENFRVRIGKIGPHEALICDFESQIPGVAARLRLRQKQIYLPGGGKTFIITCGARADSFDQIAPTFDKILDSFQAPAPTYQQGSIWNGVLFAGLVGGAVGIIVGGVFALTNKFARPKSKARRKVSPEADRG